MSLTYLNTAQSRPVASAFGLMASDLPAIVALSGKRMRFATLPKAATESNAIKTFIDGVLGGSIRTSPLQVLNGQEGREEQEIRTLIWDFSHLCLCPSTFPQELPHVTETVAQAELVEEAVVEEEFDLSEIMSEEVEEAVTSKEAKMREIEEQLRAEEEARAAAAASSKPSKKKSKKKNKKAKSEL